MSFLRGPMTQSEIRLALECAGQPRSGANDTVVAARQTALELSIANETVARGLNLRGADFAKELLQVGNQRQIHLSGSIFTTAARVALTGNHASTARHVLTRSHPGAKRRA